MNKRLVHILSLILTVVILMTAVFPAFAEEADEQEARIVETVTLDLLLPEDAPTYHLIFDYPRLQGDDSVAILFNDVFESMEYEMEGLMLPMLAHLAAPENGELRTMRQTFTVTCNNGHLLSVLFMKQNETGDDIYYSLEAQTYDVSGEYAGETLTLRGVVMVCESTDQMVEYLMPVLYEEFVRLQEAGVILPDLDEDDFYDMVYPDSEFYANPDGSVTFFFQPELMTEPSFDVPVFIWTPAQLEELVYGGSLPEA